MATTFNLPLATMSAALSKRADANSLIDDIRSRTDRALGWLLLAHLPVAIAIGIGFHAWLLPLVVGGLTSTVVLLAVRNGAGSLRTRLTVATGFMIYSAILIQESGGLIEMHFHFFCSLSFLLMYRDWRVPVWAAGVAAVYHILGSYCQQHMLFGVMIFNHAAGWGVVIIHVVFVLFQVSVLVYMALGLEAEARQSQQLVGVARRLGDGDLSTADLKKITETSSVVAAAMRALNDGIAQVAGMLGGVSNRSQQAAALADALMATTGQLQSAAHNVAESINDMATRAQSQATDARTMADALAGVVRQATEVSATAQTVVDSAVRAATTAERGAAVVSDTVGDIGRMRTAVLTAAGQLGELERALASVDAVLATIVEIASQTNLLALNAAIEAARAGEHGRGFAVVAAEVRELATRAQTSVSEINGVVTGIQRGMQQVSAAMTAGTTEVERGSARAGEAATALQQILTEANQARGEAVAITGAASAIVAASRNVLVIVDAAAPEAKGATRTPTEDLVQRALHTASTSEEVSASVEEMTASLEEITASAHELAGLSGALRTDVARFKV